MNLFLRKSIMIFSKIVAFLINKKIVRVISLLMTNVHTQYVVKQLKSCGGNPSFVYASTSLYGLEYISCGDDFYASRGLTLEAYDNHLNHRYNPEIKIGNNVRIGTDCHIGCVNQILIGNNVLIASKVFITDHFHGDITHASLILPPNLRRVVSKGSVIIEDNVWIGEGVAIMPNVRIGKNAIIGANAVVTKDVVENCVVAGNPARIIKNLN